MQCCKVEFISCIPAHPIQQLWSVMNNQIQRLHNICPMQCEPNNINTLLIHWHGKENAQGSNPKSFHLLGSGPRWGKVAVKHLQSCGCETVHWSEWNWYNSYEHTSLPKHILHLVCSAYVLSTAIRTALKVARGTRILGKIRPFL